MLTELGLRNFKAFGDEMQRAPLAPITLIYGPNSSGKSSIIQALLLLKQSFEKRHIMPHRHSLRLVGNLVNLGNYASLVHMHNTDRDIEIYVAHGKSTEAIDLERLSESEIQRKAFLTGMPNDWFIRFATAADSEPWIRGNFGMTFTSTASAVEKVHYGIESSLGIGYKIGLEHSSDGIFNLVDDAASSSSRTSYATFIRDVASCYDEYKSSLYEFADALENGAVSPGVASTEGLPDIISVSESGLPNNPTGVISGYLIDEPHMLYQYLSGLQYIGPLRAAPKRYYDSAEHYPHDAIGIRGENVPFTLLGNTRLEGVVNRWLEEFEVPYAINAVSISNNKVIGEVIGNDLVSMFLTHKCRGSDERQKLCEAHHPKAKVTLADVGFGVNQMLPLILQGVDSRNSIICVEQPEIHLHPRLQAHIADMLVDTSGIAPSNSEESANNGNQWIVETHSEMIVRRMQRRIREGAISNEDVCVLYVDPQDDGSSTIERLELDEDGRFIDEWPHGFFDEGYREIMGY